MGGRRHLGKRVSAGRRKKGLLFSSSKYFWRNGKSSGHGACQQRKGKQDKAKELPGPGLQSWTRPPRAVAYSTLIT